MGEITNPTSSSGGGSSPAGVPVAIVVAGALIAVAIYFGGGGGAPAQQPTGDLGPVAVEDDGGLIAGATVGEIRPVSDQDHIRGSANAKVTVIEYSDIECPFCKRFHPTMAQLLEEYPNDVRWVYRHFPLVQLHSQAPKEAEATECASEQGKFWEMLDEIFATTPSNDGFDLDSLPDVARKVGVTDIAKFEECLKSGKYTDKVQADLADAQVAGGRGTPYSVIIGPDGTKIPLSGAQPYANLKAVVADLL